MRQEARKKSASSFIHRPLVKVALVLVTVLCVGAALLLRAALYVPEEAYEFQKPPSPEKQAAAEQRVYQLTAQMEGIAAAQKAGRHEHYEIQADSETINTYLQAHPELLPKDLPVAGPHMEFQNGIVRLSGLMDYEGKKLWVTASVRPKVSGRQLSWEATDLSVGSLRLPGAVRDRVLAQIQAKLNTTTTALPVDVTSFDLTEGKVILRGKT